MTRCAWQCWLRRGFLAWSQRLRSIEVERCSARSIGKSRNKMCPRLQLQPGGLMAAGLFFVLGGCHSVTAFELQERIGPIGVESVVRRRARAVRHDLAAPGRSAALAAAPDGGISEIAWCSLADADMLRTLAGRINEFCDSLKTFWDGRSASADRDRHVERARPGRGNSSG